MYPVNTVQYSLFQSVVLFCKNDSTKQDLRKKKQEKRKQT